MAKDLDQMLQEFVEKGWNEAIANASREELLAFFGFFENKSEALTRFKEIMKSSKVETYYRPISRTQTVIDNMLKKQGFSHAYPYFGAKVLMDRISVLVEESRREIMEPPPAVSPKLFSHPPFRFDDTAVISIPSSEPRRFEYDFRGTAERWVGSLDTTFEVLKKSDNQIQYQVGLTKITVTKGTNEDPSQENIEFENIPRYEGEPSRLPPVLLINQYLQELKEDFVRKGIPLKLDISGNPNYLDLKIAESGETNAEILERLARENGFEVSERKPTVAPRS